MTEKKIRQNQNKDSTGKMRVGVERAYARQPEVPLADVLNLSFLFTVLLFALYVIEKYQ
jgi:hypothetical protein